MCKSRKNWSQTFFALFAAFCSLTKCCKMPENPPPTWNVSQEEWNKLRNTQQQQIRLKGGCIDVAGDPCEVKVLETLLIEGACIPLDVPTCVIARKSGGKVKNVFIKRKHPVCVGEMGNAKRTLPMPRLSDVEARREIDLRVRGRSPLIRRRVIPCSFRVTVPRMLPGRCVITKANRYGRRKYFCQATQSPYSLQFHTKECRHLRLRV